MADTTTARKIIAIATSTGGSIYLHEIFSKLPADLLAGVVICHAAPQSLTQRIVQNMPGRYDKKLALPIKFATDGDIVSQGSIYLCPLANDLLVENTNEGYRLRLAPATGAGGPNLDRFLQSVAQNAGSSAVGVVLSGATAEGAEGLRALRRQGGKTLCIKADHWTACPQLPQFIATERIAEKTVEGKNLASAVLASVR